MSEFRPAIDFTLVDEGEYQCDPHDSGNWTGGEVGKGELKGTKYGISAASYPHVDIKNLTREKAEAIYLHDYWMPWYGKFREQAVATKLLDLAVNMQRHGNYGPAILILQKSIISCGLELSPDSNLGVETIRKANTVPGNLLVENMRTHALEHYEEIVRNRPEKQKYLLDWKKRALR